MTAAEGDDTAVFDFDDDVATDGAEKEVSFHNCSFFCSTVQICGLL